MGTWLAVAVPGTTSHRRSRPGSPHQQICLALLGQHLIGRINATQIPRRSAVRVENRVETKTLRRTCDGTDHHLPKSTNDPSFSAWISSQASAATSIIGRHPQPSRRLNRCMRPPALPFALPNRVGGSPSLDGACWNAANLKACTGAANSGQGGGAKTLRWICNHGLSDPGQNGRQIVLRNAMRRPHRAKKEPKTQLRGFREEWTNSCQDGACRSASCPARATSLENC
ncbi:hypothetical protein B0T18DRAFT_58525 [Schizothecium vesticola]|uniref:Uncharacterized protein n=1 Tax=Schizothecium vesticola TaxID=314040 RepID=A0AA40K9B2_9PEZI|nr:hypothetical protein B0T18DRAFT_58525 [Schizothecium vesticola]